MSEAAKGARPAGERWCICAKPVVECDIHRGPDDPDPRRWTVSRIDDFGSFVRGPDTSPPRDRGLAGLEWLVAAQVEVVPASEKDRLERELAKLRAAGLLIVADTDRAHARVRELEGRIEYPTIADMKRVASETGFSIDAIEVCSMQGVLVCYSRPVDRGETYLGIPLAGPRAESEVIERHYTPQIEASEEVCAVTRGRACQQVIWHMEQNAAERAAQTDDKGGSDG